MGVPNGGPKWGSVEVALDLVVVVLVVAIGLVPGLVEAGQPCWSHGEGCVINGGESPSVAIAARHSVRMVGWLVGWLVGSVRMSQDGPPKIK